MKGVAKRTVHIIIPAEATDAETERLEDALADVAMDFQFAAPCDAFMSSHGGDCDDDPHCGGANPWRVRALAAEETLRQMTQRVDGMARGGQIQTWVGDHS